MNDARPPECLSCGSPILDSMAGSCHECGAEDRWIGSQWLAMPTEQLPLDAARLAAPPPDEREGLDVETLAKACEATSEYQTEGVVNGQHPFLDATGRFSWMRWAKHAAAEYARLRDAEPAPSDETCAACGRLYADEAELYCGWCGAKAGDAEQPAREEQP